MTIPHAPWLVVLFIAIAIQGRFVGFSLARETNSAQEFRPHQILARSALTLATGVWSMHFVAMPATNFPSPVDYPVLPTLISFLICAVVVGVGVYVAHTGGEPSLCIGICGLAMGLGVSLLHYVGISAVHLAGATWREPSYTAMAGMRLDPLHFNVSRFGGVEPALPRNALALLTTVVAFGVSGAFLLSLVRDARIPGSADAVSAEAQSLTPPLAPIIAHGLEPELVPMAWRMS